MKQSKFSTSLVNTTILISIILFISSYPILHAATQETPTEAPTSTAIPTPLIQPTNTPIPPILVKNIQPQLLCDYHDEAIIFAQDPTTNAFFFGDFDYEQNRYLIRGPIHLQNFDGHVDHLPIYAETSKDNFGPQFKELIIDDSGVIYAICGGKILRVPQKNMVQVLCSYEEDPKFNNIQHNDWFHDLYLVREGDVIPYAKPGMLVTYLCHPYNFDTKNSFMEIYTLKLNGDEAQWNPIYLNTIPIQRIHMSIGPDRRLYFLGRERRENSGNAIYRFESIGVMKNFVFLSTPPGVFIDQMAYWPQNNSLYLSRYRQFGRKELCRLDPLLSDVKILSQSIPSHHCMRPSHDGETLYITAYKHTQHKRKAIYALTLTDPFPTPYLWQRPLPTPYPKDHPTVTQTPTSTPKPLTPAKISIAQQGDTINVSWPPLYSTQFRVDLFVDEIFKKKFLLPGSQYQLGVDTNDYGQGTYQFFIRGQNAQGVTDRWLESKGFDTLKREVKPPVSPYFIHAERDGQTIHLTWEPVDTHHFEMHVYKDFAYQEVFLIPGSETQYAYPIAPGEDTTHQFYMQGKNIINKKASWTASDTITTNIKDTNAPACPAHFTADLSEDQILLQWEPADTHHYEIHVYVDYIYRGKHILPSINTEYTLPIHQYGSGDYRFYIFGVNAAGQYTDFIIAYPHFPLQVPLHASDWLPPPCWPIMGDGNPSH